MAIMLIDDESFSRKLVAHQLQKFVNEKVVYEYEHAVEALQKLESQSEDIELIFCDLQMPQMDGVEFVRHLGCIGYQGGVILMSGEDQAILDSAKRLADTYRLNILGSLHKPFSLAQLKEIIELQAPHLETVGFDAPREYSEAELRCALEQGELINYYQPQVRLRDGKTVGVEALVRWQHPKDGLVLPERFVPLAEEYGLIGDLTRVVLAGALEHIKHWKYSELKLCMSINVSMESLTSLEFPDWIQDTASKARFPLSNLVLEVTESRMMKDRQVALDILTRLRLKGAALSIDDFGTGYSSLAQLRDIPFSELKIDRIFVHGAHADKSLRAIFEASLKMAQQLGLLTVAEGVENIDDWVFLREVGCDVAQGYFIAKPMSASHLPLWLDEWESQRIGDNTMYDSIHIMPEGISGSE